MGFLALCSPPNMKRVSPTTDTPWEDRARGAPAPGASFGVFTSLHDRVDISDAVDIVIRGVNGEL